MTDPHIPPEDVEIGGLSPDLSLLSNTSSASNYHEGKGVATTNEAPASKPDAVSEDAPSTTTTDASATASSSASAVKKKQDPSIDGGKKDHDGEALMDKCLDLFRYIALSEEAQKTGNCFYRDYTGDLTEWAENHFFRKGGKADSSKQLGGNQKTDPTAKGLSRDELYRECKVLNLKVTTKMKKDELLEILEQHTKSTGESGAGGRDGARKVAATADAVSETKETNEEDIDWLERNPADEHGIIVTSYENLPLRIASKPWMIIARPDFNIREPVVPESDSVPQLREYLQHLKDSKDEEQPFVGCDDLNDMLPLLKLKHVPADSPGAEEIRRFIISAINYYESVPMRSIYETLFEWQRSNAESDASELLLGFGHVRMVSSTNTNGKQHESKIVNGPLFEVSVEAQLADGSSADIHIHPKRNAELTINAEVFSAIISGGKSNAGLIEKLYKMVDTAKVASLDPHNPESFNSLIETAVLLRCGGKYLSAKEPDVHAPPNRKSLVITDAWCLYSRGKKSTAFSRDARKLIDALKNRKREITEPIRGLLLGPDYKSTNLADRVEEDDLVYTLPASQAQKETGSRLFVKGEPAVILVGPPGTGKTHSTVNISTTALSLGKTVIMTSSNSRALKAFVDKLPPRLRSLCLDVSLVEEHGVTQFLNALDTLIMRMQKTQQGGYNVKNMEASIKSKKDDRQNMIKEYHSSNEQARSLLDNDDFSGIVIEAPWLIKAILSGKLSGIAAIIEKHQQGNGSVLFDKYDESFLADDFLKLIEDKMTEAANQDSASASFNFAPPSENEKKLALVRIAEKVPKTESDWEIVLAALKTRKYCIQPLLDCGCQEENIYESDGSSLRSDFLTLLVQGSKLEPAIARLSDELKERLRSAFEDDGHAHNLQEKYRKFTSEIQDLESNLLLAKVTESLRKRLDENALSTLKKMSQRLKKMSPGSLTSGNALGVRASRNFEVFTSLFAETVKFMPFLIMTTKQASTFLPPDHSCDIGIIDESSQSSCTAITFMARCKQMLIVGDDKQVSPSQCGLSEERIRGLKQSLPEIPTAEQLLPDSSFFDLGQAAFPTNEVYLDLHFRCPPEIINISNKLFYLDELVPLRLPSNKVLPLIDIPVNGTRDSQTKTNDLEAEAVAQLIYDEISRTAQDSNFNTIAAISMGGAKQVERVKKLTEDKVEGLRIEWGNDVVDRHEILYGTSSESQGDERDIVILTAVHSVTKEGQKVKQDDNWKSWNVALTRAKSTMILVRSFGISNLKPSDIRSRVFRFFLNAGKRTPSKSVVNEPMMMLKSSHMVKKVEDKICDTLQGHGYVAQKQGGKIWCNAFRVEAPSCDGCALIHIENCGEQEEEWDTVFDEQLSLERAGRFCLRVDFLSLALNFSSAIKDVLLFLEKSGLPRPKKRSATDTAAGEGKKLKTGASIIGDFASKDDGK